MKEKITGELFTLESLWRRAATTFSCPCWTATSIAVKPSCKTEKPIEAEFICLLIFHSKFINKNSIDTILPKNSFKTEIQPWTVITLLWCFQLLKVSHEIQFSGKIFTNMKIRQTLSAMPFKFVVLFLILKCKKKKCLFYQLKQFFQVPITKVILTSLQPKIHFKLCHVPDSKCNFMENTKWKAANTVNQRYQNNSAVLQSYHKFHAVNFEDELA